MHKPKQICQKQQNTLAQIRVARQNQKSTIQMTKTIKNPPKGKKKRIKEIGGSNLILVLLQAKHGEREREREVHKEQQQEYSKIKSFIIKYFLDFGCVWDLRKSQLIFAPKVDLIALLSESHCFKSQTFSFFFFFLYAFSKKFLVSAK